MGYSSIGGQLILVTVAGWRVNLRGGAEVEVTWQGSRRPVHALLDEAPASVAVSYNSVIERLARQKAARQLGIETPDKYRPTLPELRTAAQRYGWAVITLTPR